MSDIELHVADARAELVLNRPAKKNALTLDMWRRIPALVAEAVEADARLLVLRGAGGAFSAGADIAEFAHAYGSAAEAIANQSTMQAAMSAVEHAPMPTLALIEGVCVGGGCGLTLACDFRWATPQAQFAITPAKLGLAYGVADTRRLVQAVGVSRAKEILFTGRRLDAETAQAWGLVDRVINAEALSEALDGLTTQLAAAARYSSTATKQIIAKIVEGAAEDDDESRALFADAFKGEDFAEGFAAFMEKRAPQFR
jgi:enoyl-CoA hydratase/carnithine racemase